MNFELKSTFKNVNTFSRAIAFLGRQHHTTWILLWNIGSTAIVLWLYLSNQFLPATVGSLPRGEIYIDLIKVSIGVKTISSTYATAYVLHRNSPLFFQWVRKIGNILFAAFHSITSGLQRFGYSDIILQKIRLFGFRLRFRSYLKEITKN
jgi:hypothetical protein